MNLLSTNNNFDAKMQEEILALLMPLGFTDEELKSAIKFLDFSAELDLSLLNNIQFKMIGNNIEIYKTMNLFKKMEKHDEYKYSDRYILLLDAAVGNYIGKLISFINGIELSLKDDNDFSQRLKHAYRQRYDEKTVEMKIIAMLAESWNIAVSKSEILRDYAKNNPKLLYESGKYSCMGQYARAKLQLYALALAYTEPITEISSSINNESDKKLSVEDIKEMTDFILRTVSCAACHEKNVFFLIMNVLFLSVNHDSRIELIIKEKLNGYYSDFLIALFKYVPLTYLEKNAEKLFEILDIGSTEEITLECIKAVVPYAWGRKWGEGTDNFRAQIFMKLAAEKFPKEYVDVMTSAEEIPKSNYYHVSDRCYCCFYGEMYKTLNKINPNAVLEYKLDFDSDILKLSIITEQALTGIAKDEIGKYLSGESSLSILEPYFERLSDEYLSGVYSNNDKIIKLCMEHYPDFKKRYFALKSIQWKFVINDIVRQCYHPADSKYKLIAKIISYLNEENVPIKYRFELYESLYNDYCTSEIETERTVLKAMTELSKEKDSEYQSYCPNGGVFARKVYTLYLDEVNDESNKNKGSILAMCSDSSKEVRATVVKVLSNHKEYEKEVSELLQAKKSTIREAAVDIFAAWGVNNYREILLAAADKEKSAKLADKIRNMLSVPSSNSKDGETVFSPIPFVESIHKGGRSKKILWLYETQNPVVHFVSGDEADDKYMQALMLCYSNMTTLGRCENAILLANELKQDELNKFAAEIFSKWLNAGAESKKKWVLYFAAIHGGNDIIDVFLHCIKEWAENMRGAIAADAVRALSVNGSSEALMTVDNLAHKFRQKQVRKAAAQALDNAAEELGITSDELGDRIVPDLGFNESMERVFDYGARKFKVYLTPSLELEVYDENEKKLKTIPAPSKKDNEEIATQSNKEFKQMKRQLKNVISIQKVRLETALLADRRWNKEAWEKLFVKNPVMHSFAIGLIWASYENDELVGTFRYMEDGSFNTSDEDEYELSEGCTIGLVHPIDLDEDTLSTWKEQLSDYEITQPIEQLERTVYRIKADEIGTVELNRFAGRQINGMSLLGRATKFGWDKGAVLDGGHFCSFYREDIVKRVKNDDGTTRLIGNAVELRFEGMYIGGDDIEVTIEDVRFYNPGDVGCYGGYDTTYDAKALKLDKIPPRYLSEIINQLEAMTKAAEKTK